MSHIAYDISRIVDSNDVHNLISEYCEYVVLRDKVDFTDLVW